MKISFALVQDYVMERTTMTYNTRSEATYYVSQNTTQAQVFVALHQTCSKLGVFGTEVGF